MSETPTPVSAPESSPAPQPDPQPFAERLSDALQHIIQVIVGSNRKPPRRLKSLLNGTWFGHPLHPAITDVPVTAWVLTALFDVIWLITHSTWSAYASFVTVIVGLLGALGAIVTGLTDWSDTYGSERSVGFNHALFNSLATLLYFISFVLRLTAGPGDTISAAIIGFIGLASVSYAAYLGGEMVFAKGTGVNHTAWEMGSEDYEAVMSLESVEENKLYRVTVAGVSVVLLRQGLQLYAISATCPHAGGPLDEGTLQENVGAGLAPALKSGLAPALECPWHGSRFCLRDGRVLTGPATMNAPRYDVRVSNGQVELKRIDDH